MIRFVNIETGNVFNGEYPYVFWLDCEQSINMWYNKPICLISHSDEITVSMPDNNVFKLLNINSSNNYVQELEYVDINDLIESNNKIHIFGTPSHVCYNTHHYYIYLFYIIVHSENTGEYVESFYINDGAETTEYKIGADFYGENEFNHINLLNNGINIPNSIQKALYNVNVHEDKNDNITLNRKWKELLSNYWDVVANKGSYKSLYNSLKWFEYGDYIKLFELWKHDDMGRTVYEERSIKEILGDKYFETINGFSKTTYIAISSALEQIVKEDGVVQYDSESNPKLKKVTQRWSVHDLSLKLSMLGSFYKTYFMPIHMDCIRSTIEDIIYSNTFKLSNFSTTHREDYVCQTQDIKCNVKNDSIFRIDCVSVRVGRDTMFANKYRKDSRYGDDIVGVQTREPYFYTEDNMEEQVKTYLSQYFNAIGSVVAFELDIPLIEGDYIKKSSISYKSDRDGEWRTITDYRIIKDKHISFNILCLKAQEYTIKLQFNTSFDQIFVKNVKFNVIDTKNTSIKVYKIQNITLPDINNQKNLNEYYFGRMLKNNYDIESQRNSLLYKQYIPAKNINPFKTADWDYRGVCLNHLIILKSTEPLNDVRYIKKNYYTQIRTISDDLVYTICLSKQFGFKPNYSQFSRYKIYREEYVFYPGFHELIELGKDHDGTGIDLNDYIITDQDALCVIPDIPYNSLIEEYQWEFINVSDVNKTAIIPPVDIKEPFIAPDTKNFLSSGYYNIVFRYKLYNESQTNTIELNSAFLKK